MIKAVSIALHIFGLLCILAAVGEASKRERQDVAYLALGLLFVFVARCIGGVDT